MPVANSMAPDSGSSVPFTEVVKSEPEGFDRAVGGQPADRGEVALHAPRAALGDVAAAAARKAEGSAGRVERDLATIGRLAADGAVETLWFDFTTSVNGTLDPESGAIEFATGNGEGDHLRDGTLAGDVLPQLAMLVMAKGGKVVTVRSEDLDESVWSGTAMAELRFALA